MASSAFSLNFCASSAERAWICAKRSLAMPCSSAPSTKAAHGMLPGGALLLVEAGRGYGLVLGVQAFVGTQIGPELGDLWQGFVIGSAQLGRVGHAVEMIDGRPGSAQLVATSSTAEMASHCAGSPVQPRSPAPAGTGQQSVDGGRHIRRLNAVKQGREEDSRSGLLMLY